MYVIEEKSQVYFSANEWRSVSTMLQLLIFFIQSFCDEKDVFTNLVKAGRLRNVSVVYILPIVFDVFIKLMKFYQMKIQIFFLPNENSNEDSFSIREFPFSVSRMLKSLAGCRTMFLPAVFCKIGVLERSTS